jgi:N-acetylmuramic acid 6-phosphate (MurNAc-6-P) etherase
MSGNPVSLNQFLTMAFTERSNALTEDIDVASPEGIVRILRQGDAQIFSGFDGEEGLWDEKYLDVIADVAVKAAECLQDDGVILLAGCGTSGRIAHVIARAFNEILCRKGLPEKFLYFNAGGDAALFRSTEAPEDNWQSAISELHRMVPASKKLLYVGITCGLSAPAIAAQLDTCLSRPNTTSVLLGFNPPSLARKVPIEGWTKNFFDVTMALKDRVAAKDGTCFLLTPIVGPEVITGSTRMKGGSATKFMLEMMFSLAISSHTSNLKITRDQVSSLLWQYEVHVRFDD